MLLRNPIFLLFFMGGGRVWTPCHPSGRGAVDDPIAKQSSRSSTATNGTDFGYTTNMRDIHVTVSYST